MTPVDAARRWARAWKDGWESLDTEPIVACYAPDALLSTEQWDAWTQLSKRREPPGWSPFADHDTRPVA